MSKTLVADIDCGLMQLVEGMEHEAPRSSPVIQLRSKPDRRQTADRRSTVRGGRRSTDRAATDASWPSANAASGDEPGSDEPQD
jgi:hypothetical protein